MATLEELMAIQTELEPAQAGAPKAGASIEELMAIQQELDTPREQGSLTSGQFESEFGDVPDILGLVEPQQPKEPSTLGENIIGAGEAALTVGTGITGGTIGVLAGTLKGVIDEVSSGEFGSSEAAKRIGDKAAELMRELTFAPRTEAGQDIAKSIGEFGEGLAPLAGLGGQVAQLGKAASVATKGVAPVIRGQVAAASKAIAPLESKISSGIKKARNIGAETPEQTARRTAFEAEGLAPTRAQVTRDAGEFQAQQEAAKGSNAIRARIEQQEARLQGAFEKKAVDTKGDVVTSTSTPIDEVLNRSIALDKEIGNLYKQAREAAPGGKDIRLSKLASSLNNLSGEENISGGLISSIKSNLRNRGVINKEGKVVGRISVETGEQIRQDINALHNSVTDRGRQLSRQLKDSLDDDVLLQSGEDLFNSARSAKRNFEKGLNRAQISKFDKRKSNLVRDMLDNKVNPDTFVKDAIFAKKWRGEDISQLKKYLNQTESGKQAWNDLRAQAMDEIKERSFKGAVREDGVTKSLSRDGLQKALASLKGKTEIIFTPEEQAFLKRMQNIAELREPSPGTFSGKGPSAQAIREVKNRLPIVGGLLDSLSEFKQNKLLLTLPKKRK